MGMITTRLATVTDPGAPHVTDEPSRNSRDRQREARLSALPGAVPLPPSGSGWPRKGAHPQRLLWASTSTKNPRYRDVRYVEELIGRDTVNTITPATLEAFRDHGRLRASLEDDIEDARARLDALERVGISLSDVTDRLLEDGVTLFCKAFETLLAAVIDRGRRSESTLRT